MSLGDEVDKSTTKCPIHDHSGVPQALPNVDRLIETISNKPGKFPKQYDLCSPSTSGNLMGNQLAREVPNSPVHDERELSQGSPSTSESSGLKQSKLFRILEQTALDIVHPEERPRQIIIAVSNGVPGFTVIARPHTCMTFICEYEPTRVYVETYRPLVRGLDIDVEGTVF